VAERTFVTVVSGLPRSGTSLMMKMIEAGGIPVLTDGLRRADEDNPRGYYEFERVKQLPRGDVQWVPEARGKAVKVISALLEHLPPGDEYRVVFMRRRMEEVLASQRQMLVRRGEAADATTDAAMTALFDKHLHRIEAWFAGQPNVRRLDVDYALLMTEPGPRIEALRHFLGPDLDAGAMAAVIDAGLYRQRARSPGASD